VLKLDLMPTRGNYTLIIHLKAPIRMCIPRQGWIKLGKGYYTYTGSALGTGAVSLRRRVARHLRKRKKKHWHIDSLLANETAHITAIVAASSNDNKECEITDSIRNIEGAVIPVMGFGASDCKRNCGSHLVYLGQNNRLEKVVNAYKHVVGDGRLQVCELWQESLVRAR